jgi:hypothetical protein
VFDYHGETVTGDAEHYLRGRREILESLIKRCGPQELAACMSSFGPKAPPELIDDPPCLCGETASFPHECAVTT